MSSYGFIVLLVLLLYAVPSLIAHKRRHTHRIAIYLANFLGLFTAFFGMVMGKGLSLGLLVWVALLIWAFVDSAQTKQSEPTGAATGRASVTDELAKLYSLKEQGAISDEEYEAKKAQMLASV